RFRLFGVFNTLPNGFLKTSWQRSIRAPLLEQFPECGVVFARFVPLHLTSARRRRCPPPHQSLVEKVVATTTSMARFGRAEFATAHWLEVSEARQARSAQACLGS